MSKITQADADFITNSVQLIRSMDAGAPCTLENGWTDSTDAVQERLEQFVYGIAVAQESK